MFMMSTVAIHVIVNCMYRNALFAPMQHAHAPWQVYAVKVLLVSAGRYNGQNFPFIQEPV